MDNSEYIQFYNNIFGNTDFLLESINERNPFNCWTENQYYDSRLITGKNTNGAEALFSITKPYQTSIGLMDGECNISFKNAKPEDIKQVFSYLNYDFFYKTIRKLYQIGFDFGFFQSIVEPKDFNLSDIYKLNSSNKEIKMAKIGKVYLHSSVYEKNVNRRDDIILKNIIVFVKYILVDTEIHPVLDLTFPISAKEMIYLDIDLHPSFNYNHVLLEIEHIYTAAIVKHLDLILKRYTNLKQKDIDKLTIIEKQQYFKIVEMSKI